ncbi:MAG TPA: glutathione peroxidase [Bacteroidetes bacterium]|nr:glutathione peroxidase [Bacteroidota bacterium]
MKTLLISFALMLSFFQTQKSIYDYKFPALDGKSEINLADYKGKKILIVNVASECGYTYQYEDLEKLYEKYKDKMVLIGFPCNQFGFQEPGSPEEIQKFCTEKYNVTFPLAAKIDVKGDKQCPLYQWLTHKQLNGKEDSEVSWNFNKYLIDEKGNYIAHFTSKIKPFDSLLVSAIEKSY